MDYVSVSPADASGLPSLAVCFLFLHLAEQYVVQEGVCQDVRCFVALPDYIRHFSILHNIHTQGTAAGVYFQDGIIEEGVVRLIFVRIDWKWAFHLLATSKRCVMSRSFRRDWQIGGAIRMFHLFPMWPFHVLITLGVRCG